MWAHPRSRGENTGKALELVAEPGSSPLTRGKLDCFGAVVVGHGLIPAHAGKTWDSSQDLSYTRAHPRSRGENARKEEA